jgi:hypothetical protein
MANHQDPQKNQCNTACEEDGCADAFAAVAVITVVVAAVCFWLSGMA